MIKSFSIAIDGPAGSGKSSISKKIASKYSFEYLDSGAFYRTITWYIFQKSLNENVEFDILKNDIDYNRIKFDIIDGKLFINGVYPGENIRTPQISALTSKASADEKVRDFVTENIRDISREKFVIMDGRDIGTVVLPQADIKIYLTASSRVRAIRRFNEWNKNGIQLDIDKVEKEIIERDEQDSSRKVAPLKPAPDSITVDTTDMSFQEVIDRVGKIVEEKLNSLNLKSKGEIYT